MILDKSPLNLLCLTLCWILLSSNLSAQETDSADPISIKWEKLGPNGGKPFSDPFSKLSSKQLADLSYIARIQRLISEKKIKADGIDAKEASQLAVSLEKEGIEIDWLLQQRKRVIQIRGKQVDEIAETIAKKFDSRLVSIKGFATAMKSKDDAVTEFLFTPTIETCGHSTEPSPLQVIYVRTQQQVNINKLKPTPLQLTGLLSAEKKQAILLSPDGLRTIPSAYSLSPTKIESLTEVNKAETSR
jgi:hypothetical protein